MLNRINWPLAIETILKTHCTQKALGDQIGLSQSSVFKLKCGEVAEPSDSVGQAVRLIFEQKGLGPLPEILSSNSLCIGATAPQE